MESSKLLSRRHCIPETPSFYIIVQIKSGAGLDKGGTVDRGDLSKIVITRNRSGRIIRCKDEEAFEGERGRRDENWKRPREEEAQEANKRSRIEQEEYRGTRRVFTPPRNAREGEHGSYTVYENENDLPLTSKSLQERVQARLREIERRHQLEDGSTPADADVPTGPGPAPEKSREGSFAAAGAADDYPTGESPRANYQGQWRGTSNQMNFDRRTGGGFHRPDYYGNRSGYFGRSRGRGPRWRGQWDDYRGRRGNWYNRYDDRRRDGPSGASGDRSFERRRRRYGQSGSAERSPRSSRSRSHSRPSHSPSRSNSRSNRSSSASPSPIRPGGRGKVISRARITTPPLAPLTNAKRTDSDENLAELDQFVAQLRAKRQMEQQLQQQQQYMSQMQETLPVYPGPQQYPPNHVPSASAEYDNDTRSSADMGMSAKDILADSGNDDSNTAPDQPSGYDHARSYDGAGGHSEDEPAVAGSPETGQANSPYDEDDADGGAASPMPLMSAQAEEVEPVAD